ncbi:putative RNA polymerase II subunit B1 CTD phosphatase RPAP2 [Spodoptera litura]|uniref:RNA polymerase II subunit B1 CTD phosphatase RPAP2 homolog n=1 Tax=Spodoptera litura TaxID=69820 RepID=A0A9J7E5K1_SPOLT|nr:putative RNA polymerase II subunit B1 CTD phosphatase RPAP2 [Spodoptera litura]
MEVGHQKPKKRPTKIEEMSKEQIRQAILKKRECNARAQRIVESLLEQSVTETYLLQCLPDINQAHFEDIFEERSIIHLCGYPLCPKTLSKKDIPKQKYRISLKTNKVYDITARKNFCSNTCYNAALYVKKQMLTSPLWFREYEIIPTFHLLKVDAKGSMGEEVDVTLNERVKITDTSSFTSVDDFTNASLNEMAPPTDEQNNEEITTQKQQLGHDRNYQNDVIKTIALINEGIENIDLNSDDNQNMSNTSNVNANPEDKKEIIPLSQVEEKVNIKISKPEQEKSTKKMIKSEKNPLNIVGEIIEKPERKIDPILTTPVTTGKEEENKPSKKVPQKKQPLVTALTIEVEKCLGEWFTLDTLLLLFGEDKVREMVADKGDCIREYLNNYAKGIFYNSNVYDQYQALCKKLNMLELEDRKFDNQTLKRETKPLPDYTMLQEESKKMQLKVKAFFSGELEVPEPVAEEPIQSSEAVNEENTTNLPLVDKNSQNALRRRIVCQHLNKALPDILRSLGLLSLSISSDIRLLVNTFNLKANNIMFKPIQWTLIAIIFIKLLSLRDKRLEHLLEQPTAYQHMQLLLLSYKQDGGYLDRLICWLTDVDRLLNTTDTQLTIE